MLGPSMSLMHGQPAFEEESKAINRDWVYN